MHTVTLHAFHFQRNIVLFCWTMVCLCHVFLQNAFPVSGQLYTTHLLSLEALLTVIDSTEAHCQAKVLNSSAQQDQSAEMVLAEGEGSTNDRTDTTTGTPIPLIHLVYFLLWWSYTVMVFVHHLHWQKVISDVYRGLFINVFLMWL